MRKRYVVSIVAGVIVMAGALAFFALPHPASLSGHTPSPSPVSSPTTGKSSVPNPSATAGNGTSPDQNTHPSTADAAANNPVGESTPSGQGQSQPSQLGQKGQADIIWSLPVKQRAVFITIDDGWYPSQPLLQIMQREHLPVTAFLIEQAADEHPDYWTSFLAAGGSIENHTLSHPDLTKLTLQAAEAQVRTAETYLTSLGPAPTLFRPPYGDYNTTVCQAVYQAGIKHVIMWNSVMNNDILQTYNGKTVQPGSIILLHFVPDLDTEIRNLLSILQQNHLGVASLPQALTQPDNLQVVWPQSPSPAAKGANQPSAGSTGKATSAASPSSGAAANGA